VHGHGLEARVELGVAIELAHVVLFLLARQRGEQVARRGLELDALRRAELRALAVDQVEQALERRADLAGGERVVDRQVAVLAEEGDVPRRVGVERLEAVDPPRLAGGHVQEVRVLGRPVFVEPGLLDGLGQGNGRRCRRGLRRAVHHLCRRDARLPHITSPSPDSPPSYRRGMPASTTRNTQQLYTCRGRAGPLSHIRVSHFSILKSHVVPRRATGSSLRVLGLVTGGKRRSGPPYNLSDARRRR
jgi:hypothetical protein